MITALILTGVLPLLVVAFIGGLLFKLRRRGRPDRSAEAVIGVMAALIVVQVVIELAWPQLYQYLRWPLHAAIAAAGFGFMAIRVYFNRHLLRRPGRFRHAAPRRQTRTTTTP